jgi:nitrogen fixation/metabolism regulation signal transduction histidine kinase
MNQGDIDAVSLDKMLVKLQSRAQQLVYKEVLIKEIFDTVCDSFQEDLSRRGTKTAPDSAEYSVYLVYRNGQDHHWKPGGECHPFPVEDNGQGIQDENRAKIFEMYFRANDRSKGNGLGPYIVKKAVQKWEEPFG